MSFRSRLPRDLLAGAVAGAGSYLMLLLLHGPWEEIVAAALIGSAAGLARRSPRRSVLGAGACAAGWVAGTLVFGVWIELGIGAWLVAGAFLGGALGVARNWRTALFGLLLGTAAGFVAEVSRYLTVVAAALRAADMQLLLLFTAGVCLASVVSIIGVDCEQPSART